MPIAVTEDHEALRPRCCAGRRPIARPSVPRAAAETPPGPGSGDLPDVWEKMAGQGWLGLHLAEEQGGHGFTLAELAVVLEELGHALLPGPVLTTVLVSAALARLPQGPATVPPESRRGLADGSITAAVALGAAPHPWRPAGDGALALEGGVRPVLGLPTARLVLIPLDGGASGTRWLLLDRARLGEAVGVEALPALDGTRALGAAHGRGRRAHGAPCASRSSVPEADVRGLSLALAAAESAGIARWCLHTASEYAKVRVQFGRPIGQFQAVKHALADMLVAVEQCAAVAWDAAAAWSDGAGIAEDETRDPHRRARIAGAVALGAAGALRQGVRPAPRRHRLHLGARCPLLPEAGHGQPSAVRRRRRRRARARGGRPGHRRVPPQPGGRPAVRGGVAAAPRSAPWWRASRRPTRTASGPPSPRRG